ncbi:MAG TPA: recombinase family protein, partial [Methylomirabilota bacterium]|nr:recombinase family protein [Methylomirabilota bacterium]
RLTRDTAELLRLHRRLQLKGIDIVGVSDGIATNHQGAKVQLTVKGLVNEIYLDDLREKTHRGLSGRVARGLSPGGRTFGYHTIPDPDVLHGTGQPASARYEIEPREAEIVRRIFRDYAAGRSMKQIAHALNAEAVPFPAKDTKRGPARRGWALSTIHVILRNEKYAGVWIWNRTKFLKDPDTGRRRPIPRPPEEWVRQERPELRIVEAELWDAVRERFSLLAERYECGPGRRPGGSARLAYSPYLLSGLLRCGVCGARMTARTITRKKNGTAYRYGWYACSFAVQKGPAVCGHARWYRRERLEGALLDRFREATTPSMVETITRLINARLAAAFRGRDAHAEQLKAEILRLERETGNLVRFLAQGGESDTIREELRARETALHGLRVELAALQPTDTVVRPEVHPAWVQGRLEQLDGLVRREPVKARMEIAKHFEEDLILSPLPSVAGERRAEVRGRVKADSTRL